MFLSSYSGAETLRRAASSKKLLMLSVLMQLWPAPYSHTSCLVAGDIFTDIGEEYVVPASILDLDNNLLSAFNMSDDVYDPHDLDNFEELPSSNIECDKQNRSYMGGMSHPGCKCVITSMFTKVVCQGIEVVAVPDNLPLRTTHL